MFAPIYWQDQSATVDSQVKIFAVSLYGENLLLWLKGLRYFEIVSLNGSVLNKTSCCKFPLHYNLDFFYTESIFTPLFGVKLRICSEVILTT